MQPQGAGNVGDHAAMGQWGLPPIAQSYDQHGGDSHGQASVDRSSSSCSKTGDRKSQAKDESDRKQEKGYSNSSDKQPSSSTHDDRKSSRGGHPRDDRDSSCDRHPRDDLASHSHNGDGKKSTTQKTDDDREAGKLAIQNIDALLQDDQLKNILFAGISKATAKLEQSLKTTDKKLENDASSDDLTSRHKVQQSVQISSAVVPQKPKSILKRKTGEERVDVESKVSTESQVSSDSFSKLSALEKTLHLLCGKTNIEDVVRGSEKDRRGSEKPSFKPVGALSLLESYNDSGDDYDHAEKDTKKQNKTKKNAPSTRPFWSADAVQTGKEKDKESELPDIQEQLYEQWRKSINLSSKVRQATSKEQDVNQLSIQTGQTHNLASSSLAIKASDNDQKELGSTVQNILQSIGFNFDLSKRKQELARQKKQQDVLHTGMINQSASFLEQSEGLVQDVKSALFSDKQKKAQLDSLTKEARASMQQRSSYERSASPDALSAEDQRGKSSYGRKGGNADPDDGRSRIGLGSRESRSDRVLENFSSQDREQISPDIFSSEAQRGKKSRKGKGLEPDDGRSKMDLGSREIRGDQILKKLNSQDWEDISSDEDDMGERVSLKKIEKIKRLSYEKQAEVRQQSVSRERDAASPPHSNLLDEAQKLRNMLRGGHEKSLWLSERFRDEPKDEYLYRGDSDTSKATALFAALSSKRREVPSSSSKSLRLPLQSGSVHVENLRVTSRTVLSDDDESYIESRKVPRKRPASPPLFPVSKERRVFSERGSINDLQSFLRRSLGENAPEICQALGLDVDSYYKSPMLKNVFGGLNVGGLPVAKRLESSVMSDHFNRDSVRKSPDRQRLRSPDVRTSRSPGRHLSMSPKRQNSRSPARQMSWSPSRRTLKLTDRRTSRSPDRRLSMSPKRRKYVSPGRHTFRSPDRRRSISLERRRSLSPDRRKSRSPDKRRSRSPEKRRYRSPDRCRSKSLDRQRSKSPDRWRSRSPDRQRSVSLERHRSWSPDRFRSKSPDRFRSRSPDRFRSRSPDRCRSRSPDKRRSRSPDRRRSVSLERRRSWSPDRFRSRSPDRFRSRSPDRFRSRSPDRFRSRSPDRFRSRSPDRFRSRSPDRFRSRSPDRFRSRSPDRFRSRSPDRFRSRSPDMMRFRSPARIRSPLRARPRSPDRHRSITPPFIPSRTRPSDRLQQFAKHKFPVREMRTLPIYQTTAFRRQLPAYKKQNSNRGKQIKMSQSINHVPCRKAWTVMTRHFTRSLESSRSNKIKQPAKTNVSATSEEDRKGLPAAQSKELSEVQKKGPLKEQPKEHVQELRKVQDKEPKKGQEKEPETGREEQHYDNSSKIALKNDIKTEILGEFPVDESKTILIKRQDPQVPSASRSLPNQEKVYYEYYDSGSNFCQHCSIHFSSLEQLLEHNHMEKHLSMIEMHKKPWKSAEEKQPKCKVGLSQSRQIKGAEMMFPLQGFYCSLCRKFFGDMEDAANHLKDDQHYDQYMSSVRNVSSDDHSFREDHKDTNTRLPVIESVMLNGLITRCLYDTGLQFDAIVETSLVNPDQFTEETIDIQGPLKHSVPMSLPVAKVNIFSNYVTGKIRAAVLDDPIYPVILGCRYIFLGDHVQPMIVSAMTTRQQARKAPAFTTPTNSQREELKQAQAADSTLADCFDKLPKAHSPPCKGEIYMKNGLLHRREVTKGQEHAQLVVPSSYRAKILDMGHSPPFSGHMPINANFCRISAHYYWPGMNADISRYVKSCPQCQRVAPKYLKEWKMPITGTPFETVAVYIVGRLNRTKRRNCYILTLVDTCSMWAEAVPMPSIDSKHVSEALLSIFTRLGFPLRILTVNGSLFSGRLTEHVFRLFQSRQVHTSPYHIMLNGTVNRFNSTITFLLRNLALEKPETWDTYIPATLFAYREVPHHSTGMAPATLLFGRPIKGPLEALLRTWTDDQVDETVVSASTYVAELKHLQRGWKLASYNLRQAPHRIAHFYEQTKDRRFKVGEKVLLLRQTSQNKLQIAWKGPYEVIKKISHTNYRISITGKHKIFHINLLRKYDERSTTETAHLMALAVATEVDHGNTMGVEYPLQAKDTYQDVDISPTLTQDQQQQIQDLLATYTEILTDKPGLTDLVTFDMKLIDPITVLVKTDPVPDAKVTALRKEIQQMLSSGIISPSESPYSASVVLLRKPSGEHRLCIDYRQLNAITEFQAEPLPDQNQFFTSLSRAKYFTRIDLSKGYYQIPVKPEVRQWLAFSTPDGHYEFNVVPFGLSNASSVFMRMMRKLLKPLHYPAISNIMDDILIATETFEEHSKALHLLFKRLKETGLTARPKKCQIGFQQLDFHGHMVSQGFMTPHEGNIEKLQQAPCPRTKKDIRSFVSLCGFYQRYINDFNSLTAPLINLTRKGEPDKVIWSAECEKAYSALKKALTAKPIFHLPDLKKPFILRTDASNIGIGAILLQRKEDEHSILFPVAYASRRLNSAEIKYSAIEKECLALVWAVEKLQTCLYGKHFTVQCDHQPLMFLAASRNLNSRLMRWSLLLQPYSFHIEYIPGESNVGADFLSRHPVPDTVKETKEKDQEEEIE